MSPLAAQIDPIFAGWDRPDSPGAALAIFEAGRVVFERGYGSAHLESGTPITPTTVFNIGSVSKQFTAFAVALLGREGALSLDDPIRDYLPELPDVNGAVTIRHLVHHTSGLRDPYYLLAMAGWQPGDVISSEHILAIVRTQKELNSEPGQEHLYCTGGYALLAEIISRVTGQRFSDWTKMTIFEPLEMTNTQFCEDHRAVVENRASPYAPDSQGGFVRYELNEAVAGPTNLHTTVEDLPKWIENLENGTVGGIEIVRQMRTQGVLKSGQAVNYAFGLGTGEYRGLRLVGHGGSHGGYASQILHFPDRRLAVAVLMNVTSSPHSLALQVVDRCLGNEAAPAEARHSPDGRDLLAKGSEPWPTPGPAQLAEFTGAYYSNELDTTYRIIQHEGQLLARQQRLGHIPLRAVGSDQFEPAGRERLPAGPAPFLSVRFVRSEGGRITALRLSNACVRSLQFDRDVR
jgi:CubicO group peptidase (beta-lactamase class C family)